MRASVGLGQSVSLALKGALLMYRQDINRGGSTNTPSLFLTQHEVKVDGEGIPSLGPAGLVDRSFMQALIQAVRGTVPVEILPGNVVARTPETLCWWVPASRRTMFYQHDRSPELSELSGHLYPQPALVFSVQNSCLSIRALETNNRPGAATRLYRAPYWNVSDDGRVCLGTARAPRETTFESMARWEACFFESEFTHANAHQTLTKHSDGFIKLWCELKGAALFPSEYLADAGQTLAEFVRS